MNAVLPVSPACEAEQTKNTDDYGYDENIAFHEIGYPTFIVRRTFYWMIRIGLGLRKMGGKLLPSVSHDESRFQIGWHDAG